MKPIKCEPNNGKVNRKKLKALVQSPGLLVSTAGRAGREEGDAGDVAGTWLPLEGTHGCQGKGRVCTEVLAAGDMSPNWGSATVPWRVHPLPCTPLTRGKASFPEAAWR